MFLCADQKSFSCAQNTFKNILQMLLYAFIKNNTTPPDPTYFSESEKNPPSAEAFSRLKCFVSILFTLKLNKIFQIQYSLLRVLRSSFKSTETLI